MTSTRPAPAVTRQPRVRANYLPFSPPTVGQEEIDEVVDTLQSLWITTGPKTQRFEKEFAASIGSPDAAALSSCTAALHTALLTAGIGNGDQVITTPLTFAATANTVEHVGATPVFADVDPLTLCIDPAQVEKAITPRTRAIVPVHYAGHPAELDALRSLAAQHNLVLIEDAAHALPARYKGVTIGACDNPVAFSFYATKNLTTAEGGMLTGTPEFIANARLFGGHGISRDAWKRYAKGGTWKYEVLCPGFKYNMTDIQASLGLHQLQKLRRFHDRRREIAETYTNAFSDIDALQPPTELPHVESAWHLYVLRINPGMLDIGRDEFLDELAERQIGASVHFIPLHTQPFYRNKYGFSPSDFPVAYDEFQRLLSLPLHPGLSDTDVDDVISAVADIVSVHRR